MNNNTTRKSATRPLTGDRGENRHTAPAQGGALVQFAAQRAHDLADTLHALATQGIDDAQRSLSQTGIDSVWRRSRPLIVRASRFVVSYPWRAGGIVALLVGAALLTRTPDPQRG